MYAIKFHDLKYQSLGQIYLYVERHVSAVYLTANSVEFLNLKYIDGEKYATCLYVK